MTQDPRTEPAPTTPVPVTAPEPTIGQAIDEQEASANAVPTPASPPEQTTLIAAALPASASDASTATPMATPNELSGALASATLAARSQALEIAQLCQLAGQSTRIASFLVQGVSASQVRQTLLSARAQSEEITSLIDPDAPPAAASANTGASAVLMAAVKKLSAH